MFYFLRALFAPLCGVAAAFIAAGFQAAPGAVFLIGIAVWFVDQILVQ